MNIVKIKINIDLENLAQIEALNKLFKVVGGGDWVPLEEEAKAKEPVFPPDELIPDELHKHKAKVTPKAKEEVEPAKIVPTDKTVSVEQLRAEVKNTKGKVSEETFKKCREELTKMGETSVANLSADQRFEFMHFLLTLQELPF
jgi:hypothetical protein